MLTPRPLQMLKTSPGAAREEREVSGHDIAYVEEVANDGRRADLDAIGVAVRNVGELLR